MSIAKSERFLSLDILRGITVACMIMVNNQYTGEAFASLRHKSWDGATFTDMVFPFFLFIVGASLWFAMKKTDHKITKSVATKILWRGAKIFLVGLLLNYYPFTGSIDNLRILGVLQRIAIVYVLGSFLAMWLKNYWRIVGAVAFILLSYWVLVMFTGGLSIDSYPGTKIDVALFGAQHIYSGYGIPFDPEGLLSTYPAIATMLLGYLSSMSISKRNLDIMLNIKSLFWAGLGLFTLGLFFDQQMPINKPIWSSSYVLVSGGWAMMIWSILSYVIDYEKHYRWCSFLNVFGTNAIFAYALSGVISPVLYRAWMGGQSLSGWFTNVARDFLPERWATLAWSLVVVAICWAITYPLYKKSIFIKL